MGPWAWSEQEEMGVASVCSAQCDLRPLNPKLPNPRPGLAPTPPGPSLDPALRSFVASGSRLQPLILHLGTLSPDDPV